MLAVVSRTEHIAEAILIQKRRRRLTYTEVGAIINLSRQSLDRRLRGETAWKYEELDRLASAWGINIEDLTDGFCKNGADFPAAP